MHIRSSRPLQSAAALAFIVSLTACAGHGAFNGTLPGGGPATGAPNLRTPLWLAGNAHRVREIAGSSGLREAHGGAGYPVTAEPAVRHPNEAPCVDKLFDPHTPPLNPSQLPVGKFADYADHPFNYAPPSNCPGPYAKIIFKMHFQVSAGVQYDRTGAVWIGGTNVFFGTTAEPGSNASPNWQVERDVTEYAPIFAQPSTGQASVYNIVNSQYTGIIYGTAELDFYPVSPQAPAATVADAVYPLAAGPTGGYVNLPGPTSQMIGTFSFPTNVEAAYLDVFLESQSTDEFWYTCFPNDLAGKLGNCGNTGFREGEVTLDGQPAGVAPIYPWIYSGGIDPYLWVPIPGVDTLNFKPYRINLTPFAAQLDDGNKHTIAVSVFNDGNYFNGNAALLVYEDHGSTQVTGGLVSNGTAIAPTQVVTEHVKIGKTGASGTILVTASHPVSLNGYVNTSQGRVSTRVRQSVSFSNLQDINFSSTQSLQVIKQQTTITSNAVTRSNGRTMRAQSRSTYPLNLTYNYVVSGSTATQKASVLQTNSGSGLNQTRNRSASWSLLNTVQSSDTLNFVPSGYSPSGGKSRQEYRALNLQGHCYSKTIKSLNYVIVSTILGC
jgi:hypothetical protein